jgi:hypothetical protein
MCPTVIGRIHTRVSIIVLGPALIGLIFTLVSGHLDWLVLVGVYLMLGIFLDTAVYPWLLKWQPPWVGGLLAIGEFGLLLVLAGILNDKTGGLHNISIGEAIWFYWLCWVVASLVKIVCCRSRTSHTASRPASSAVRRGRYRLRSSHCRSSPRVPRRRPVPGR